MSEQLTQKLLEFVETHHIHPNPDFRGYKSGVYALVDCIFSSQARYSTVVNLISRLNRRFYDQETLTFTRLMQDIQKIGVQEYSEKILTRQKIGKKLKTEIVLEAAQFLAGRSFETKDDLLALEIKELEKLILVDLVREVYGIGSVVAEYLLILLSNEQYIKADTHIMRLMQELAGPAVTADEAREAITTVAKAKYCTPARLDNALWTFESGQKKPIDWSIV